jgi:putative FmdB family regulatory protein
MPTYDFECQDCAYYAEIKQGINDPSTLTCPHCEKSTLVKVFINAPAMFVRGEPTTIGHQADRNTQKMGKYELQEKINKDGAKADKEQTKAKEARRKINSMTPEQKVKWIKDGD